MKYRRLRKCIFSFAVLAFLILILLFPSQARNGAAGGLLLWFNVLLPTLLPFMILSDLIRHLHIMDALCERISSRTGKNLYFLYPLLLGLLCGLPLGAKLTAEAVKKEQLTKNQGQFLLTVCNNASSMFLIGYVAEAQLQLPKLSIYFLILLPLSSILAALFTVTLPAAIRHHKHPSSPIQLRMTSLPNTKPGLDNASASFTGSVSTSIMDSFSILTRVGGYVILFSILAEFLLLIDTPAILPFVAFLEMTSGVRAICASGLSVHSKILLSAASVSFTGLSGIAQTADVFSGAGFSLTNYIIARLLSALFSMILFSVPLCI